MAPPIAVMMIQTHQKVWPGSRLGLSSVMFSMLSAGMTVSNADEDGANDDGSSTTEHAVSGVRPRSEGHDPAPGSDRGLTIHVESDWTAANAELSRQFPSGQNDPASHMMLSHWACEALTKRKPPIPKESSRKADQGGRGSRHTASLCTTSRKAG
eukprot:scaffold47897_cov63-Phaeocystis_antarctica.AAC.6